jgi:hypothetical protein
MELTATIVLAVSVLGIAFLFYIKHWEEKNARIFSPVLRLAADGKALEFKAFLNMCESEFRKIGPTSMRIGRVLLHDLALTLAALSRASERQAHRLADVVSHKHRFERRETKNDFLKQVSDVPMRNSREVSANSGEKKGKSSNQKSLETEG